MTHHSNDSKHISNAPFQIMRIEFERAATRYGVANASEFAAVLSEQIIRRLGGTAVYIRSNQSAAKLNRYNEIRNGFDGTNARLLALRYGLSLRTIYRITGKS